MNLNQVNEKGYLKVSVFISRNNIIFSDRLPSLPLLYFLLPCDGHKIYLTLKIYSLYLRLEFWKVKMRTIYFSNVGAHTSNFIHIKLRNKSTNKRLDIITDSTLSLPFCILKVRFLNLHLVCSSVYILVRLAFWQERSRVRRQGIEWFKPCM